MIERIDQPFESSIAGVPVGRLRLDRGEPAELAEAIADAAASGVRHLVATIGAAEHAWSWKLNEQGFRLVDVAVTLRREKGEAQAWPEVRMAVPEDLAPILRDCATLFPLSRYYTDPFLGHDKADELHRRWITNSFQGRAAAVFVADHGGEAAGFLTALVDGDRGRIDLVGVAPHAKGRGLGTKMISTALHWFDERVSEVLVKTQAHNYPALAIYTRLGFFLYLSELTYSLTL